MYPAPRQGRRAPAARAHRTTPPPHPPRHIPCSQPPASILPPCTVEQPKTSAVPARHWGRRHMAMRVVPNAAAAQLTRDRVALLGTQVDRVPRDAIDAWITAFIESGQPHQVVTANLDFIAVARKRPPFAQVIAEAALVVCDG